MMPLEIGAGRREEMQKEEAKMSLRGFVSYELTPIPAVNSTIYNARNALRG